MKLNYMLLDVFTTAPLSGNPLAVVHKADGLLDNQMQAIATEFGAPETVFLTRPTNERHSAGVRIFTPERELPFAGHPTIGAAAVLALQNRLTAVRLEEAVGMITCVIDKVDRRTAAVRFALPQLPAELVPVPEKRAIAMALGVEVDDLGCGFYQPCVFSAGVVYYLIPVKNTQVLRRLKPNLINWSTIFPLGHQSVYCFTEVRDEEGVDLAARMFSGSMGFREDPGTGSAAAALIGLLAKHADFEDGAADRQLRQGFEMGRPSRISLHMRKDKGVLTHGGIGGHAVVVGEGWIEFEM